MASNFIGSTVLITVRSPPNAQLKGTVQDIQDRVLFLRDVLWLDSGSFMPTFEVPGSLLLDLEVVPSEFEEARPSPLISASSPNTLAADHSGTTFVDPAILSVGKPPPKPTRRSETVASATLTEPFSNLSVASNHTRTSELDTTELPVALPAKVLSDAPNVSSPVQQAFQDLIARSLHIKAAPVLRVQRDELTLDDQISSDQRLQATQRKTSNKRGRKQADQSDKDLLKVQSSTTRKVKRSSAPKHNSRASEAQNGWATEEATDIQELGEFDFAANLSKFDKREIFRQLKEDDTIAAGDRLVGHNRIAKPGTAGGKNLHWTENVLDSPAGLQNQWNSEAGETADDLEERPGSGRSSTRQKSHSRNRMVPSRKGSHNVEDTTRRQSQMTIRQQSFETAASPRNPSRKTFSSPYIGTSGNKNTLRIVGSNRPCLCISPIQMLELEQHAIADLGLNDDILAENAARGIAEIAIQMQSKMESISTRDMRIVVVVGSHKTGARTLAAARQLRNRGFRVTAAIMGREEDFLEQIRQQANAFSKAGGEMVKMMELVNLFNDGLNPTILIDALTGMHTSFEDLRREDQQWCFEIAIWTDRLRTQVVSIDVPSGVDPSTGIVGGTADGHALSFHPDTIIALGAPKPYLLSFLEGSNPAPKVYIADLSLGRTAWKRMGGRRRTGVDFGTSWVVELKLDATAATAGGGVS